MRVCGCAVFRVTRLTIVFLALAALFATVVVACGDDAEPETIIKEVTKEVPVEVVRTVEVVKTVEVDKIVEVVKEPEPTPVPEVMTGPAIYQMGIFEEPIYSRPHDCLPKCEGEKRELMTLPGEPPDLTDPPAGCRFHPRCAYATDECRVTAPPIVNRGEHWAACWNPLDG